MIIAVDFDGTCVEHVYPLIGDDVPGCVEVLKELLEKGHELFLWTMRDKRPLEEAVRWFKDRDIHLIGVNKNPRWGTGSPKEYAHVYIDDAALGCPLVVLPEGRPYVDWSRVKEELKKNKIL